MTQTIVDKLRQRTSQQHNKLVEFAETYDRVMPTLRKDAEDLEAVSQGIGELKNILDDIQGEMTAGLAHLEDEGSQLLAELVNGSANNALLVNNIVEVYMRGDHAILVQALMELDPPLRRQAFDKLPVDLRRELLRELTFFSELDGEAA